MRPPCPVQIEPDLQRKLEQWADACVAYGEKQALAWADKRMPVRAAWGLDGQPIAGFRTRGVSKK